MNSRMQQQDRQEEHRRVLAERAEALRAVTGQNRAKRAEEWAIGHLERSKDPQVASALNEFQAAVNGYWLLAIRDGVPDLWSRTWLKTRRKANPGLAADDVQAEAIFILRGLLIEHAEDMSPATLAIFGMRRAGNALDRWLAGEKGLPVSSSDHPMRQAAARPAPRRDLSDLRDTLDEGPNPEQQLLDAERAGLSIWDRDAEDYHRDAPTPGHGSKQ